MAEWPVVPDGFGYPLVDMTTKRLNDPTMEAIAASSELSATYAARNKAVFVKDFGAVGDGVTDDILAIQAAADTLVDDGARLVFEGGAIYATSATLILPSTLSNFVAEGNGATLLRIGTGCALTNKTMDGAPGYGSGGRNWAFRALHVQGSYADGYQTTLNFNHVEGLRFLDCNFTEGMAGGHYLDLLGCTDVFVEGCLFAGMNPESGAELDEAIQLDISTYTASSAKLIEPTTAYDGLPTRRVHVRRCRFTTYETGGVTYPLPSPIGSHSVALEDDELGYYQDIWFEDNEIEGYRVAPVSPTVGQRGWLRFIGARDVFVRRNVFRFGGPSDDVAAGVLSEAVIVLMPTSSVVPADQAGVTGTPTTVPHVRECRRIAIEDNHFLGFEEHPLETGYLIYNYNGGYDISIRRNKAEDLPLDAVYSSAANDLEVTDNTLRLRLGKRGIAWGGAGGTGAKIHRNRIIIDVDTGTGIACGGGSEHMISQNYVNGGAIGVDVKVGTTYSMVTDNRIEGYVTAGVVVSDSVASGTATDILVANNIIKALAGFSATANAMLIGTKANRTRRFGNQCRNGGAISDSGSGSITAATDQSS